VLHFTRFGRYVFAIGGNEHAGHRDRRAGAPDQGSRSTWSRRLSAGIAGVIETGWLGAVTTNLGAGMELQVIAAAVIGGANLAGGVGNRLRRADRLGADRGDPQQPRACSASARSGRAPLSAASSSWPPRSTASGIIGFGPMDTSPPPSSTREQEANDSPSAWYFTGGTGKGRPACSAPSEEQGIRPAQCRPRPIRGMPTSRR